MLKQLAVRHLALTVATALGLLALAGLEAQEGPVKPPPKVGQPEPKPSTKKAKKKAPTEVTEVFRVAGELTVTDPIRRGGQHYKMYEVKMSPGKTYLIRLFDQSAGAGLGNIDPFLLLEDARGANLAQDDDGEGNLNSRIEYNPVREESYKIYASSLGGGRVGKYLLTVDACPPGRVPPRAGMGGGATFAPTPTVGNPMQPQAPGFPIAEDLEFTVLSWGQTASGSGSGGAGETHGYFEYRYLVENLSDTRSHRITLTIPSQRQGRMGFGHFLGSMRKTVEVEPRATRQLSIFQPDLSTGFGGVSTDLEIDGRLIENARLPLTAPQNRGSRTAGARFHGGFGGGGPTAPTVSLLVYPAAQGGFLMNNRITAAPPLALQVQQGPKDMRHWSNHWLGYTTFDGIIIDGPLLKDAPPEVQGAIWQYIECGGTLLVIGEAKLPESWERTKTQYGGFTAYYPGFGQCLAGTTPLLSMTPEQCDAVNEMWSTARAPWHQLQSPTGANIALPILDDLSIPVRGLFVVMVVFVLLIGPVNVYWLSRNKRRIWLLWTVPIFAGITCAMLVGYMVVTEGWNGHVRTSSVTVLDENSQRASTIGWLGYYCPTTPGDGLRFSLDTELSPHFSANPGMGYRMPTRQPCSMEWTSDQQHLTDGWITAKVPLHFLVRRGEKRLERINVRKDGDGKVTAVNGLSAEIQSLWVAGADGTIQSAQKIAPGASAALTPTEHKCAGEPGGLVELFSGNWIERGNNLAARPAEYLRPGCYVAVFDTAPFLEQGLRRTQSQQHRSVVFGVLKSE